MTLKLMDINRETIRQILHGDFGKRKTFSKFVPHSLTDGKKGHRVTTCEDYIRICQNKKKFSGRRRHQKNVTAELNAVSLEAFDYCCLELLRRCKKCVEVKGDHFEGNNSVLLFLVYLFL
jgi:hypothetical protein